MLLEEVPGVFVCTRKRHLPGVYCKPDGCYFSNDNFCFTVLPEQHVFQPENVAETPPRPGLSPNLWISDPAQGLPQTLTLTCREPLTCSSVELVFDTNLDYSDQRYGFPRGTDDYTIPAVVKETVNDYRVDFRNADGEVFYSYRVEGNIYRRNVHVCEAPAAGVSSIDIVVEGSLSDEARIFGVKVFS